MTEQATQPTSLPTTAPTDDDGKPSGGVVPVTEAIRYRKRAQAAEQQLEDTSRQLESMQGELEATRTQLSALERRQRIDELLTDADVVDLEAARLLTEVAVGQMDEADLDLAVTDLRRHKPYLFRQRPAGASAMPAHPDDADAPAEAAAQRAAATGNLRDLLAYLRLRRNA